MRSWYDTMGHVKCCNVMYSYHPASQCVWYDSWDKVQVVTFSHLVRELLSSGSSGGVSSLASLSTLSLGQTNTVLTRNYAPPFCQLGLAKSMGGAYNRILVINLVYTPPSPDTVVCTSAL